MSTTFLGNIYLACPYSDPERTIREYRVYWASKVAAHLIKEKKGSVFSPISMGHMISAVDDEISGEYDFWKAQTTGFLLKWADCLVVLTLPGWEQSKGINAETEIARQIGMPIYHITQNYEFV